MKKLICLALVSMLLLGLCPAGAEEMDAFNWYEIFVYSYQDSDGNGVGDLNGVRQRLDYIQEMGFDGIWLMPIMPSPSYHKYDVTDYYQVDPLYGTAADLKALAEDCHARGIRLIIDLVVNHTSAQHPWFREAAAALRRGDLDNPYIDYYCFSKTPGNKMVSLTGTDWYYEEQFSGGGMPDLNLESPAVMEEIGKIMAFWLNDCGVDGFRLDAVTSFVAGNTDASVACLRRIKEMAENIKPGSYLVGEAWTSLAEIAKYYESGVDSFFLFPASQAEGYVAQVLRAMKPGSAYAAYLKQAEDAIPDGVWAPFLSSHDTGRAVAAMQARTDPARLKFAHALLNMMGGNTFTYYGEEIGMAGSGADPNKRTAMYWNDQDMTKDPPGVTRAEYPYPSVDEQWADPDSLLHFIRAVNETKKQFPAIARGAHATLLTDKYLCLLSREWQGETIYLAINFSAADTLTLTLPEEAADAVLLGQLNAAGGDCGLDAGSGVLILPPYGIAILGNPTDQAGE